MQQHIVAPKYKSTDMLWQEVTNHDRFIAATFLTGEVDQLPGEVRVIMKYRKKNESVTVTIEDCMLSGALVSMACALRISTEYGK